MDLSDEERIRAASALDDVLKQVTSGAVFATAGQASYIAGAVSGLRGATGTRPTNSD